MYYMYLSDSKQKILFPVTPSKINLKVKNQNKTITLISEGEVNWIKTPGLTDIEIDKLILPMFQKYPFAVYENGFKSAAYFLDKLESWKKSKSPLTFIISRTTPDQSKLLFDTNMSVTIEDYEILEDAEKEGFDVSVKLMMKQYRFWGAKKLVVKKKKASSTKKVVTVKMKARKTKTKAKSYVVKKGDCLIRIARKQLNDGSKWKSIYKLNKKTIENAAKKHGRKSSSNGHWIYPGTKLKLPS